MTKNIIKNLSSLTGFVSRTQLREKLIFETLISVLFFIESTIRFEGFNNIPV